MTADPTAVPSAVPTALPGSVAALPRSVAALPPLEQPRRAFVAQVMGLPVSVHVRGPSAHGADVAAAVEALFDALRADDVLFSTWRPGSEVSRIRRGAATGLGVTRAKNRSGSRE